MGLFNEIDEVQAINLRDHIYVIREWTLGSGFAPSLWVHPSSVFPLSIPVFNQLSGLVIESPSVPVNTGSLFTVLCHPGKALFKRKTASNRTQGDLQKWLIRVFGTILLLFMVSFQRNLFWFLAFKVPPLMQTNFKCFRKNSLFS